MKRNWFYLQVKRFVFLMLLLLLAAYIYGERTECPDMYSGLYVKCYDFWR